MSSIVKVDTIQENTSANGITVDGLNIKDSKLVTANSVVNGNITNDAVTVDKLNLISTSSVPSLEAKGDGSSQDGYIQLNCSQNSHGIKLKSPAHSANASYTLTFPPNDGDANQFLKTDGSGGLSFAAAGGITAATTFRLNASSTNSNSNADITANWEVVDTPDYSTLGSAVSQSSGIFSFPSTGYWLALCHFYVAMDNDGSCNVFLKITTDNSTYTTRAYNSSGASGAQNGTVAYNTVIDVTNTTNVKCKFATGSFSSAYIYGETAATTSGVTFIRLGDT
tara:strand:- start:1619 stop:2461 length:843 start_codon:yes stop_codon:yes gene_type:complete